MILTPLMPHQVRVKEFLEEALRKYPCAACFLGVGLGKSLIALSLMDNRRSRHRVGLVTSDKRNVETTWPEQIYTHTDWPENSIFIRPDTKKERRAVELGWIHGHAPVIVANYDWIVNRLDWLLTLPVSWWIGDESSEFKDQRTRRSRRLIRLVKGIPNRLILNGKPATERLEDLYGQYLVLDGGLRLGHTITGFRSRYMQPSPTGYGWVPKRSAFTQLQRKVKDITLWQEQVEEVDMPKVVRLHASVPVTPVQKRLLSELRLGFSATLDGGKVETNYAPVVYQKMMQICGGILYVDKDNDGDRDHRGALIVPVHVETNKLDKLWEIIQANPWAKIVVWHQYVGETKLIETDLLRRDRKMKLFTAAPENLEDVATTLEDFRKAPAPAVLLIRNSFCRGLNQMADADIAVFYTNPYSYARRAQAEGRTRRLSSQNMETYVIDITTEGGADEAVYMMISQKKDFSLTMAALRAIV